MSSYTIWEEDGFVEVKCRDAVLDRSFFEQFIPTHGFTWMDVHVLCEDVQHVTLDFTGVTFADQRPGEDDPVELVINPGDAELITLVSQTKTGFRCLTLSDNKCYNLSQFNGEGVEFLTIETIEEGLVVDKKNFPSPIEVSVFGKEGPDPQGGPIHFRGLTLTGVIMDQEVGDVLFSGCRTVRDPHTDHLYE